MASEFGRTLTPTTTQWYMGPGGGEDYLQCPFCSAVDWCPQGKTVSKDRIFSRAQRQAGRVEIRNEKFDQDCCKNCDSQHKMPRVHQAQASGGSPMPPHPWGHQAAQAFGHVNVTASGPAPALGRAQASGHVDQLSSSVDRVELVFLRDRPPGQDEFIAAAKALHELIPTPFWEKLHALLTEGTPKCKATEALLRRTWSQCEYSAKGLLKTLSHCGAVRPWAPSEEFPLSSDKLGAFDSSGVAYKDFGNAVYHTGMLMVYGRRLQCVSSEGSVGDLVEAALGFGYYMRWCVNNGYDKEIGVKDGYDYALASVEQLETVMNFIAWHQYNKPYLDWLYKNHMQSIIDIHGEIGALKANGITVAGWRTEFQMQTHSFRELVIYEPRAGSSDDPMEDADARLPRSRQLRAPQP